jgi:glycosyltransferase involved in cell wall biosynthesis
MEKILKVSVVMCTCNGEKYIVEQLESIVNQTYPLHELIIQDDCSTDNTWSIIKEYENKHPYIKCYSNKNRIGVNPNFKKAFFHASGEIIAPSDQDDIWDLTKIEKLVELIGDNDLAYSKSTVLYEDQSTETSTFPSCSTIEQCIWNNPYAGHTGIFKSSILKEVAKCMDLPIPYDHCICLIAYSKNAWIKTDSELQIWRRHRDVITKQNTQTYNNVEKRKYNKLYKISYASIKLTYWGSKPIGVKERFDSLNVFFTRLKIDKTLVDLTKSLSKQTLLSYLYSAFVCAYLRKSMFPSEKKYSFRNELARLSFAFRYPFIYWFDNHLVRYL